MKLYRATSLDDIAKHFRARAKQLTNEMDRSLKSRERDKLSGQIISMNEAAVMLENMELVEK